MIARLLTILTLSLPLAACAAAPAQETRAANAAAPADAGQAQASASAQAPAPLGSTPVQETPAVSPAPAPAPAPAIGAGTVTAPAPGPVTMPAGSATGSLLQTLFALIVVLAVLGGLAWFLKRYGPKAGGGSANLRIVGSLNLGGRERLLVVEVGNQWIVVGASPGRVNALATMPKQEGIEGTAALAQHAPSANSFADWLKQTIDKRK
jgi:flagellar biosynthetic protein FliO